MKDKTHIKKGVVIEEFPDTKFKVELENSPTTIRAYVSGKMKVNKIRVMLGDKVDVVFDPSLGGEIGRIIKRY